MSTQYLSSLDDDSQRAVAELTGMIRDKYPDASFAIEPSPDEGHATHITAVVDAEDPDDVMDLVIDRLVELQVQDGIPVSVIPIRTPERVAALRQHALPHLTFSVPPFQM
jgi:hypothetical protein